jgi:hypothetical protein
LIAIHNHKEIENLLLVLDAIDRAAAKRLSDHTTRTGKRVHYTAIARSVLEEFATAKKDYVMAQYLTDRRKFERARNPNAHEASITEASLKEFAECWQTFDSRVAVIPGKEALSVVNQRLQRDYSISITPTAIIEAMGLEEIPTQVRKLVVRTRR